MSFFLFHALVLFILHYISRLLQDMLDFKNIILILIICLLQNQNNCLQITKHKLTRASSRTFKVNFRPQMLNSNGSVVLTLPLQIQNQEILTEVNCEPKCIVNGSKIQFPSIQFTKQLKSLTVHNIILPHSQHNTQIIIQIFTNTKDLVNSWRETIKFDNSFQALESCSIGYSFHKNQEYSPKIRLLSKNILKSSIIVFQLPQNLKEKMQALYDNSSLKAWIDQKQTIECFYNKELNQVKVPIHKQYSGQLLVEFKVRFGSEIMPSIPRIVLKIFDKKQISLMQQITCQQQPMDISINTLPQTRLQQAYMSGQPYLQVAYSQNMWFFGSTQTLVFTLSGYPTYYSTLITLTISLTLPQQYTTSSQSYCQASSQYNCTFNQNYITIVTAPQLPLQLTITLYNIINPSGVPYGYFYLQFNNLNIISNSFLYPSNCSLLCQSCAQNQPSQCTSCYTGYYLYNSQCVSSCPQSAFIDDSNYTCWDNYCPPGTYQQEIKNKFYCSLCNPYSCTSCSQNGDYCFNCSVGYYLQNGACYLCNVSCSNCLSSTICLACQFGQNDGQCYTFCPLGYYQFNTTDCLPCNSDCVYCDNQHQCLFCNQGYYLQTTIYQTTCSSCPKFCSSCIGNGTCYSCFPGFYSIAGTCYPCGSGIIYGNSCASVVVPFPFTILSTIIIILTVVSYYSKKSTLSFVMDFSLNSLVETISCLTIIGLTASRSGSTASLVLICLGYGIGFILSVAMSGIGVVKLPQDSYYTEWKNKNKVVYYICIAFSLVLNGRFFFFQFSRAFNTQSLNAVLHKKTDFKILRFILMATLVTALLIVIGCLVGIIQTPPQISVIGNPVWDIQIDCLIVHVIGMTALIIYIISSGKDSFETSPNPMDTERSQQTEMSSPFEVSQMQSPKYVQPIININDPIQAPARNAENRRQQEGTEASNVGGGSIVRNMSNPVVLNNTGR